MTINDLMTYLKSAFLTKYPYRYIVVNPYSIYVHPLTNIPPDYEIDRIGVNTLYAVDAKIVVNIYHSQFIPQWLFDLLGYKRETYQCLMSNLDLTCDQTVINSFIGRGLPS